MKKYFTLMFIILTLTGCSEDEEQVTTPNVQYSSTNLTADFYTDGNGPTPTIEWNGNQGSFSLDTNIPGLSVNSSTGQVNYTRLLPPGDHSFNVIAANSAGQINIPFSISNSFSGFFEGTYSTSSYFAIDFFEDGTLDLAANSSANPDTGTGTYTINGDELIANYMYDNDPSEYSIKVTVSQTNVDAQLSGSWFFNYDAPPSDEGGPVSLILQ